MTFIITISTKETALSIMLFLNILPSSFRYLLEKANGVNAKTVDKNISSFLCNIIFIKSSYPCNKKRIASAILHIKKLASSPKIILNKTEFDTLSIAKNTTTDTTPKTHTNTLFNNFLLIKLICNP